MFKVNEYFAGKVKSLGFNMHAGPATIGVMAKGEYEFGTSQKEIITLITGAMSIQLPGAKDWKKIRVNESFEVAAHQKFLVQIDEDSSYLCLYR
ncbi:MAG: pyrimidine/purine nucleoside phosphorylase [Pseudomonadota bacterium]